MTLLQVIILVMLLKEGLRVNKLKYPFIALSIILGTVYTIIQYLVFGVLLTIIIKQTVQHEPPTDFTGYTLLIGFILLVLLILFRWRRKVRFTESYAKSWYPVTYNIDRDTIALMRILNILLFCLCWILLWENNLFRSNDFSVTFGVNTEIAKELVSNVSILPDIVSELLLSKIFDVKYTYTLLPTYIGLVQLVVSSVIYTITRRCIYIKKCRITKGE